jgi:hypothetical protein
MCVGREREREREREKERERERERIRCKFTESLNNPGVVQIYTTENQVS